ncbi:type I methionyl aminopeptidase [Candidatus Pelagibacter bacterium]|nr:type I methionyl aminopeptidase [Candidatus Pelagibacter bacterium]
MTIDFKESFEKSRIAGSIASRALDEVAKIVKPGISTNDIDKVCYEFINDHAAYSAPLFYRGFPKSCCTSANHVVCHGIPSDKILKDGDIVNVDVTAYKNGWHGDTSRMFKVGEISIKAEKLINTTYESMMRAINIVKEGIQIGDIGSTIQNFVEAKGFSVVQDFCGHGIGQTFHKEPNILHYGEKGTGEKIKTGMIFTIEPMINIGNYETKTLNDGWTAVTRDKSLSAQFEHTIGVTEDSYEIFTQSDNKVNIN